MALLALLEDETDLREELEAHLSASGHTVLTAGSIAEFELVAASARLDIAVIDRGLPDGDGISVADSLRRSSPTTGIILLTARGSVDDKIAGLQGGADHYLVKPVKLPELSAHVAALLRRLPAGWRLVAHECCLYAPDNAKLVLSNREFDFLALLARGGSRVVTRREVVEAFGEDWFSYDLRRLDTLVSRLRRRCRDEAGHELPIRTEHGRGYLTAELIEST
ncbi:response regulator transcription factor [Azoarcus sp. TTM-91]|uniref:response regulator transcription factor n=1 Tax=Azoarcus sp. TTM-91 TaxID=2691581 RepID=UPI00145DE0EF|nr:response regulator transcription factor [Azoarcus sp. TTM-91]